MAEKPLNKMHRSLLKNPLAASLSYGTRPALPLALATRNVVVVVVVSLLLSASIYALWRPGGRTRARMSEKYDENGNPR